MAALKEVYTEATRIFDRLSESVKLSEPLQNKFLETIIGLAADLDATFLIANAHLKSNFPIIYCSEAFSEDTGFPRYEVTRHDVFLEFLRGRQTPAHAIQVYEEGINKIKHCQVEMILYSNKGYKQWYLVSLFPVKKDCDGTIGFFLIVFNNISHLKPIVRDSPRRNWKRAVKKILNKPSIEQMRKNIDAGQKHKKARKSDMETIRHKITNCFVPEYGGENFQVPRYLIKHFNSSKVLWDTIIITLILYTAVAMPFVMSFEVTDNNYVVYFDIVIDVLFIMDMALNFFTTYVDNKGEIVTSPKTIRMHYLKGWFTIDCVAAIPYFTYFIVRKIMKKTDSNQKIIIIKLARLLRMTKVRKKMHNIMQMSSVTLLVWIIAFSIVGHWMACVWYAIAINIDSPCEDENGWLYVLSNNTGEFFQCTKNNKTGVYTVEGGPKKLNMYFSALYYTLSSLTTCGFGNIAPNTVCEKVFGCITMLTGCVLYAFIFGQVTNIISQMQKNSNEFNDQLDDIKSFNGIYKVPHNVGKRLEDYFRSTWAVTKGTNEEEILKICPRDLQSDLCLHIHSRIFDSNKGFKKLSQTSLRAISRYLCTIRTATGDKVVYFGEYVDTIYFVATGALEVKNGANIMGLIGPGDAFGQRLGYLEHYGKSLFDVEACSFGTIHCITRDHLREALALFPEEYEKIRYGLVLSLDITRQIRVSKHVADEPPSRKIASTPQETPVRSSKQSMDRERRRAPPDVLHVHSDGRTELDYHETSDVLTGMSELKGELRRETERMNSKMGVVEAQMRLVLKLLRRQHKINDVDPEIGLQLNELMAHEQTIDDCNVEWSVADADGWKVDHYKNSAYNETYDDTDNELENTSGDSLRSGSEIEISRHYIKTRNDVKMINVRKYSELRPGVEIDDDFEENFKSSMKI